jgi:hypothetical protein
MERWETGVKEREKREMKRKVNIGGVGGWKFSLHG